MTYRVRISPSALSDIESIYEWIKKDSPVNADAWFNGVFDTIKSLEMMPLRYAVAPEAEILEQDIRHCIYRKNYRILYNVIDNTVRIYHVRHSARQWMTEETFYQ